jgi:regulator of ribonuclease activity A
VPSLKTNVPFSTADLYDAQPAEVDVIDLQFRSFGHRVCFHGQIETLRVFEDHAPVRDEAATRGDGRVLVVDGGGSLRAGLLGDRIGSAAAANGWVGVIIVGAIRDSVALEGIDIGVRALGTTARRSDAGRAGLRGITLQVGGVVCRPGDWLYADRDAVIISRKPLKMPPDRSPPN